jgi:hypothetical protein
MWDDTLAELGLADRTDPVVEAVAKRLIQFAHEGEVDRHRLRELTVNSFRGASDSPHSDLAASPRMQNISD